MKEILVPQVSVNDEEVTVVRIIVTQKQKVSEGEILAEIETSKALVDIVCNMDGFADIKCVEGEDIAIGSVMFEIYESIELIAKTEKLETEKEVADSKFDEETLKNLGSSEVNELSYSRETRPTLGRDPNLKFDTKFSKKSENLIKSKGIDRSVFQSHQFVNSKVIDEYLNTDDLIKDTRNQKVDKLVDNTVTLKKLSKAKVNEISFLSDVNSTGLVSQLGIDVKATINGIKNAQNFIESTPLPTIIHEMSRLLKSYSNLNCYYENNHIANYNDINIGVAFDDNINGLKVGTINKTDELNLRSIEDRITDLSIKYQENKLSVEEITSHTVTISDLFSTEITAFKPLVNSKNSIILGIASLQKSSFRIECCFDHRISSGLEISHFLKELKNRLESRFLGSKIQDIKSSEDSCCIKCGRERQDDLDGEVYFTRVYNSKFEGNICSICLNGF